MGKNKKEEMDALKIELCIEPAETLLEEYQVGKANDFEVICKDGEFGIHQYCLNNSEFLYKQHQARTNFEDKGKFNLKLFRKRSIKIAFDALYGLHKENITIHEA